MNNGPGSAAPRPWYREPWPWVLIAIPLLTILASAITLWLAVRHPDQIVVDEVEYQRVQGALRLQESALSDDDAGQTATVESQAAKEDDE